MGGAPPATDTVADQTPTRDHGECCEEDMVQRRSPLRSVWTGLQGPSLSAAGASERCTAQLPQSDRLALTQHVTKHSWLCRSVLRYILQVHGQRSRGNPDGRRPASNRHSC